LEQDIGLDGLIRRIWIFSRRMTELLTDSGNIEAAREDGLTPLSSLVCDERDWDAYEDSYRLNVLRFIDVYPMSRTKTVRDQLTLLVRQEKGQLKISIKILEFYTGMVILELMLAKVRGRNGKTISKSFYPSVTDILLPLPFPLWRNACL
jgi:hypothetical protein